MSSTNRVLEGKIAIVTGASRGAYHVILCVPLLTTFLSGIGAGICENLASKGCSLIANYTSESSASKTEAMAKQLQELYGVNVLPVQADMGSENGPAHIVQKALSHFANPDTRKLQIDIVINNAGLASNLTIDACNSEDFAKLYNVNVRGPLFLMKAVMPYLPDDRSGRIVNVSSVSASCGFPAQSVYGGTKAALEAMTRTWARELAERATVNAVNPGPVATDMWDSVTPEFEKGISTWNQNTPLSTWRDGVDKPELKESAKRAGGRPVSQQKGELSSSLIFTRRTSRTLQV